MSLVICSNLETDANINARESSIYKPYNFRNSLSSNLKIPKNAQIALQSCKINLDGTITIGQEARQFFYYFGQYIDGTTLTQNDSVAYPVRATLFDTQQGTTQVNVEQLAEEIQNAINRVNYHPNLRGLATVDVERNASTGEFKGFKFQQSQYLTLTANRPPTTSALDSFRVAIRNDPTKKNYTYFGSTGIFRMDGVAATRNRTGSIYFNVPPMSHFKGKCEYNISDVLNASDGNGSHCTFMVGLSRGYNSVYNRNRQLLTPPNFIYNRGNEFDRVIRNFVDFGVRYNRGRKELELVHTVVNSANTLGSSPEVRRATDVLMFQKVVYHNGSSDFRVPYNACTNASDIGSVVFTLDGEVVNVDLKTRDGLRTYNLYKYDANNAKEDNLKMVSQDCWDLLPSMSLRANDNHTRPQITLERFNGTNTVYSEYDLETDMKCGWSQQLTLDGRQNTLLSFQTRPFYDYGILPNASSPLEYSVGGANLTRFTGRSPVIIMKESEYYPDTLGANVAEIFGYGSIPNNGDAVYWTNNASTNIIAISPQVPKLLSTRSIFVRVENMTQQSINARQGNKSTIIAHLPRFDGQNETGRLYFQPNQMIFLDLNNPEEININNFDISFVYSNEQYCTSLTGQSIVCLYLKSKETII